MKEIASYYNKDQDRILIEVQAESVVRLFNPLDPAPIRQKVLDEATSHYIAETVGQFPLKTPMKLLLYLPDQERWQHRAGDIPAAVHYNFSYRRQVAADELRALFRRGRICLVVGLIFVCACVAGRELTRALLAETIYKMLAEGLLICGWVAMWRPIQIFLYDWWPIRRERRIYSKLADIEVEVVVSQYSNDL